MYIMSSPSRTLYTGVTNDIVRRVHEHKDGAPGSFAARYRTRDLVYLEQTDDVREAIAREKQIKGWLRSRKIDLIEQSNPGWCDLSAGRGREESRPRLNRGSDGE